MERETIRKKIKPLFERWKKDYIFKTMVHSVVSFSATVLFALYNGFLGICLLSIWHGSICVFYLLLVTIRGMVLLTEKKNGRKAAAKKYIAEKRIFILSAGMLLVLNMALILPISLMVTFEKPVSMGLIPAIAMAAYTTYKVTMASIHIQKQKSSNHNNLLVTELRTINFIDALVSILTLQNTLIMVNQSKSSGNDMFVLSAVSSAAIYMFIMFATIRFQIKGFRQLKEIGKEKTI